MVWNRKAGTVRVSEAGYSLLEILVGLTIIAMIAALVGPRLLGQVDRAKTTTAKAQIRMLRSSMETMRLDIGRYPTADEGLELLVRPMGVGAVWGGPYINGDLPTDPWGNAYRYSVPALDKNADPSIFSYGADNKLGGNGNDADVGQ